MESKNFYKKKLENGLTILFEKRSLPIISVALAVRFGSAFEAEKEKGISHFIEHMLFKGTKKRTAKQISTEVEEKGGEHNAFTAKTFTTAWVKLPRKYLEFSIDILSDLFFNSEFDERELGKERMAILEEIKMYHDTPSRHVFEELSELMYNKPFGISPLGSKKTVSSFSEDDLIKKYKDNYFTENFVLCIVGDADFDEICKLGEKYFEKISKKIQARFIIPKKIKGDKQEKRKGIDQAHFSFGVHMPNILGRNRYAAEIFHSIFAADPSSRIFQEVREKRGLAYAVYGGLEQEGSHGEEFVYIGTIKEKIELVKKIVISELKKMSKVKGDELEKIKNKLINFRTLEREDSKNVLFSLLLEEVSGNAEEYYDYNEKIQVVKLEDVRELAKSENYSSFSLIPES